MECRGQCMILSGLERRLIHNLCCTEWCPSSVQQLRRINHYIVKTVQKTQRISTYIKSFTNSRGISCHPRFLILVYYDCPSSFKVALPVQNIAPNCTWRHFFTFPGTILPAMGRTAAGRTAWNVISLLDISKFPIVACKYEVVYVMIGNTSDMEFLRTINQLYLEPLEAITKVFFLNISYKYAVCLRLLSNELDG